MAQRSDRRIRTIGLISLALLLLVGVATFNLQQFPGFRGDEYHAEVSDAAGLRVGAEVQIAGIRVGRVNRLNIGQQRVVIDFDVKDATLGSQTRASIEVKNLLGEKFLNLTSVGSGRLDDGATIPLERSEVSFDIVGTLGQLTTQTEVTDRAQLTKALGTLGETLDAAAPEAKQSLVGLARLSDSIASRDQEVGQLLTRAKGVLETLDSRKGDLVKLMGQADLVFKELQARKQAIHDLLVDADQLVEQLQGVVKDNKAQLKPTLDSLQNLLDFFTAREDQIEGLLRDYGPYVNILGNIVGSGPWFDAYVPNITGAFDGEFLPASPPGGGD